MTARAIVSPEDQSATFIELFFDLVFVFSVTQVVGLFHHGIDGSTLGQGVLVFWLVWWAWTQFTWALNAADTTHPLVELGTLLATAVAFFMAVGVTDAFHGHALAFAIPYVLVRVTGLGLYAWVAWADPSHRAAVGTFSFVSLGGLVAVIVGALVGGAGQYWIWGLAIGLDVIAAGIGGRLEGWNLHPEHFAERHGLIVIIALGETLIVAAGGLTGKPWTGPLVAIAVLAVGVTCALWWTYFTRAHPRLEHAIAETRGARQSSLARDVYSLMHFPMLCGVIAYAVAVEEGIAHPADPLTPAGRAALALGVVLFVAGMGFALKRATGLMPWPRVMVSLVAGLAIGIVAVYPVWASLALAFVAVAVVAVMEQNG